VLFNHISTQKIEDYPIHNNIPLIMLINIGMLIKELKRALTYSPIGSINSLINRVNEELRQTISRPPGNIGAKTRYATCLKYGAYPICFLNHCVLT